MNLTLFNLTGIEGRDPVDKLARIVTQSATPIHQWNPKSSPGQEAMAARIQTALQQRRIKPSNGAKNYIGQNQGKLTVVYYAGNRRANDGEVMHYWLVRCNCGEFEIRRHIALARKKPDDACEKCKRLSFLKRHQNWKESQCNSH